MKTAVINCFRGNSPSAAWRYLTYLSCAASFALLPFFPDAGRDLFYLAGYSALLCFAFNLKFYIKNKSNLTLPLILLVFAVGNLLWLVAFKKPGDYINVYRAYMTTSRLVIAAAFIVLVVLNEKLDVQRPVLWFCIAAAIGADLYAFYQSIVLGTLRVELSFDRSTIVAYILTAMNLLMMQSVLRLSGRYRIALYSLAFFFSYTAIVFTGTRAAMLLYPFLIILSAIAGKGLLSSRHKIAVTLLVPLLLAACGFALKDKIAKRIGDAEKNFSMQSTPQGEENAIFSRLWMQVIALKTGNKAPLGQSAEQRAGEAKAIIASEPSLSGAEPYLTVHMHNEILETWSLKGIWGVILLAAVYLQLLVTAFRPERNPVLLAVSAALIIYGLSDVILFSSEAVTMFLLAIVLSLLTVKTGRGQPA